MTVPNTPVATVETPSQEPVVEEVVEVTEPVVEEPAPEVEPEPEPVEDGTKLSHEDALGALAALRKSEALMRTRLRETEDRYKDAKTPEQVHAVTHALIVENVALSHNLPADLAGLLQGSTREELAAHAKVLSKYAPVAPTEDPELEGGLTPGGDTEDFDPVAAARAVRKNRY